MYMAYDLDTGTIVNARSDVGLPAARYTERPHAAVPPVKPMFLRAFLILAVLVFITFFSALIATSFFLHSDDLRYFERDATVEARLLEDRLQKSPTTAWPSLVQRYKPVFETDIVLVTLDQLLESGGAQFASENQSTLVTDGFFETWRLWHPLNNSDFYLKIQERDLPPTFEEWVTVLIPLIAIIVILGLTFWIISRYLARPINILAGTADALGTGNLDVRAPVELAEPARTLAHSINLMADRIQTLIRDQQVLIGALPHELRTPIARVRFALDMTRTIDSRDELRQQLEKIDEYVAGLETVVDDTLTLARLHIADDMVPDVFSLRDLVTELIADCQPDGNQIIEPLCGELNDVKGSESLIRLALGNLLDNALKYGRTRIRVQCDQESNGDVSIAVEDDGPGIPAAQRQAVFTPFSRLDNSRTRSTGGIGLGLAIVDVIARRIKGHVSVDASELGGARFVLVWPGSPVTDDSEIT